MSQYTITKWVGVLVLGAFFFGQEGTALADWCEEPSLGPRACDFEDSNCPDMELGTSIVNLRADYSSVGETIAYMQNLDADFDDAGYLSLIDIGRSVSLDYVGPGGGTIYEIAGDSILAARVTQDASDSEIEKPKVLLVCNIHAMEWIASEVCIGYVNWLVQAANGNIGYWEDSAEVQEMLEKVEIWAVFHANAGGRLYDENYVGTGLTGGGAVFNNQRKTRSWDPYFQCEDDWSDYAGSASCDIGKEWEMRGVDPARNFSHKWPVRSSTQYLRPDFMNGYPANVTVAPEKYDCDGNDALCGVFPDHHHCVRMCDGPDCPFGDDDVFGCFMTNQQWDVTADGLQDCEDTEVIDSWGIEHSCLRTLVPVGGIPGFKYMKWECGQNGAFQDSVWESWPPAPEPPAHELLGWCNDGTLQSCHTNLDVDQCMVDVTDAAFDVDSVFHGGNRYCSGGYCAVNKTVSCCSSTYRGVRPFETVESRALRDLVNNVPFSFVVDLHASRNDLTYFCNGAYGGCGGHAFINGDGVMENMREAYNEAAEDSLDEMYPGYNPGIGLPLFLDVKKGYSIEGSSGQFPEWAASMPEAVSGLEAWNGEYPTQNNFDNGTLRGVISYTWELGSRPFNDDFDDQDEYGELVSCSAGNTLNNGTRVASSLMVRNQVDGAKGLVAYLAEQAETPNNARIYDTVSPGPAPIIPGAKDVALVGLRIDDGRGRGLLKTEKRWEEVGNDATAEINIPAGTWRIFTEASAGADSSADILDAKLKLFVQTKSSLGILSPPEYLAIADVKSIPGGSRDSYEYHYKFEPNTMYKITATLQDTDSIYNDTTSNDIMITQFKVIACDTPYELPNGDTPDEYCYKGLPFRDLRFECWDGDENPFGYGRCRECWSDAYGEQGCDGLGGFCFEGMCDDSVVCWSGQMEDVYEEKSGGESPVKVYNDGNSTDTVARSLYRKPDSTSGQVQDVDSLFVLAESAVHPNARYLAVRVRNHCSFGKHLDEPMEEVEVKVQQLAPELSLAPYESASYQDITDWEHPLRISGIVLTLSDEELAAFVGGYPLRVQVRNSGTPLEEFSYTLEVTMSPFEMLFELDDYIPLPKPGESLVWPMGVVSLSAVTGEAAFVSPSSSAMETGGWLHFDPSDDVDVGAVSFVLRDSRGEVAIDEWGQMVGEAVPRHGGLAIPLDNLTPRYSPYRGTLVGLRGEEVVGKVLLCPDGTNDCSMYEPTRDICGAQEGEVCCVDDNGGYVALDPDGDDPDNCGACGLACEWDELCLKGTCVEGLGTRCWNTDCPDGTFCISDGWFGADPRCEAILVDREHCGWFEDVCEPSEQCQFGFCLPKLYGDCDVDCGIGEACCWQLGTQVCVDVLDNGVNCGACGNICDAGDVCSEGSCMPWYSVYDPCLGDTMNCGEGGSIDCVNIFTDEENCGGCKSVCSTGAWCEDGRCTVEGGEDDLGEE